MAGESLLGSALGAGLSAASAVNPAFAAIGAIPELYKGILGITQGIRARKIEKSTKRPVYVPPGAATEALDLQRNLAGGDAPGLSVARNQLASNLGASMGAIRNSGGGQAERLAALSGLNRNAGASALELAGVQEDWKARQDANLINELNRYSQWQQNAWEYNQNKPFEEARQAASDLRTLANKNIHSALKGGAGLAAATLRTGSGGAETPRVDVTPLQPRTVDTVSPDGGLGDRMRRTDIPGELPISLQRPSLMPDIGERGRRGAEFLETGDGTIPVTGDDDGVQPTDDTLLTSDNELVLGNPSNRINRVSEFVPNRTNSLNRTTKFVPSGNRRSLAGSGVLTALGKLSGESEIDRKIRLGEILQRRYNSPGGGRY